MLYVQICQDFGINKDDLEDKYFVAGLLRNVYILRENKYLAMYFLSMSFLRLFVVSVFFISGLLLVSMCIG